MGGGREYKQEKGEKYKKKYRTTITSVRRQTPATAEEAELSTHGWGQREGGSPPPGARGLQDHGGARLEESWKGRAGGAVGGRGGSSVHARGRFSPLCPSPRQICPPGTVWSGGGGAGGQASSTAAGTLLSTEAKNAEREMKPEEDQGSGYVRAATVHSTTATAHGARGAVFPPRGGAAVIWGGCSFFLPPPRATKWGTLSCKGQRRVGCTVRSLLGQVFE